MSKKKSLVVIDIRTQGQWDETGIIDGSHKITAFDILGNLNPNFIERFYSIVMEDEHAVFISDRGEVSAILTNGFVEILAIKNVYSLKGGIQEWIAKNNKVIKKLVLRHHQL